jgi:exodeoxyribonuclease-1
MSAIWAQVFEKPAWAQRPDVDQDLYGGFLEAADRRRLNHLRTLDPTDPAWRQTGFDDERLPELVFRYRARNHPEALLPHEAGHWQAHCAQRLLEGAEGARTTQALFERIDELAEAASERGDERAEAILGALYDYAEAITADG